MSRTLETVGIVAIIPLATIGFWFPLISKSPEPSAVTTKTFVTDSSTASSLEKSDPITASLLKTPVTLGQPKKKSATKSSLKEPEPVLVVANSPKAKPAFATQPFPSQVEQAVADIIKPKPASDSTAVCNSIDCVLTPLNPLIKGGNVPHRPDKELKPAPDEPQSTLAAKSLSKASKRTAVEFTSASTAKSSSNHSETTTLTPLETLITPTPPEATSLSTPLLPVFTPIEPEATPLSSQEQTSLSTPSTPVFTPIKLSPTPAAEPSPTPAVTPTTEVTPSLESSPTPGTSRSHEENTEVTPSLESSSTPETSRFYEENSVEEASPTPGTFPTPETTPAAELTPNRQQIPVATPIQEIQENRE